MICCTLYLTCHLYPTGKVDMVVGGAGTGGTISGIGRKIKEVLPNCKVQFVFIIYVCKST